MESKEIIEGNKLIAKFDGKPVTEDKNLYMQSDIDYFFPEDLKYHSSWDWLMPVVEKIRNLGFNFSIVSSETDWSVYIIGGDTGNMNFPYYSKLIDAVYTACVQFITWLNSQSK